LLRQRGAGHDDAALRAAGLSLDEREVRRRMGREYEELIGALDVQLALAKRTIKGE